MLLGNQGTPQDAQECHPRVWSRVVQICGVLPCPSASYLRRRKGPAVPKRDLQKMHRTSFYIFQSHEDARGPHVIKFSAPFAVVKQYHVAGNTVVNSYLKIRNNDDRDFAPKMTFFRTLTIFREFGMSSNSLGTNQPTKQKRVQIERLEGWIYTYIYIYI